MPSVVQIDSNFEHQVRALRQALEKEAQARKGGTEVKHYLPEAAGWDGNLNDLEGMHRPFQRDSLNQTFDQLASTGDGVVGDGIAIAFQVDALAVLERAFRARHTMTKARAVAHATGRRYGQGLQDGSINQTFLEYLRGLLKQSKVE